MRQDECKAAAYALMAFANMPYGNFRDISLRDVPEEIFAQFKDRLPDPWQKRATHYYEETARAQAGASAWRNGNLNEYGRLIFESGYSSIANYECGCDELKPYIPLCALLMASMADVFLVLALRDAAWPLLIHPVLNRLLNLLRQSTLQSILI